MSHESFHATHHRSQKGRYPLNSGYRSDSKAFVVGAADGEARRRARGVVAPSLFSHLNSALMDLITLKESPAGDSR